MPGIRLDIVTAERMVYSDDVDMVVTPGCEGQLGILPHHTPLMTTLLPGELRIKKGGEEISLAISGGFLEVRPDRVVVLADAAERGDEIDVERAEAARKRAQERLSQQRELGIDGARAEAALCRSLARLRVAEMARRRKSKR
ncbi:MAG: F0F1 ATP synthase subunit epsilon [Dehalococcoidales bacterium]|nr:F0F1 ATP synthase subunit epsilon [Dehalococcoidales bacterium]